MAREQAQPETARYWQHDTVPGVDLLRARYVTHRYGRHAHETYTFALIEAGVEEFDYGHQLLRAGTGSLALLNPDVAHTGRAGTPEGWTYRVLYPQVEVVSAAAAELGWRPGTPYFPQTIVDDPASAALLRRAHRAAEHGDQLASSSLLTAALGRLLTRHATPGRAMPGQATQPRAVTAPAAVATVREVLAGQIADPPNLADLAAATGLSQFALLRAFRAATGLPPHAYLTQLRVRRARTLLDGGLPAGEVAALTGFADQAHLTRQFKRVLGVPPAAYQRERLRVAG